MRWRASFGDGTEFNVEAPTTSAAIDAAFDRYIQEVLKLSSGAYTVRLPNVEPLNGPGS